MKAKKLLSAIVAAAMTFGAAVLPAMADGITWEDGMTVEYNGTQYDTLKNALNAVYMSSPTQTAVLNCKPNANVGALTHAHVADDIKINGNGAYVSGGEQDLEFDTYMYDRATGKQNKDGKYLEKDITIEVDNLTGIAAWCERNTKYPVNVIFKNCKKVNRIMYRGGDNDSETNVILDNCTLENVGEVHSTKLGTITVKDCTFTNVATPINLNNKSTGEQKLIVENSTFVNCSTEDNVGSTKDYAAPIRFANENAGDSITNASISGCKFVYDEGKSAVNGDILIGEFRANKTPDQRITATISNTDAAVTIANLVNGEAVKTTVAAKASETASYSPIRNQTTVNTGAVTGTEDSVATGFLTTLTNVIGNTIKWTITSEGETKTTAAASIGDATINGDAKIGLVVKGLFDAKATASAVVE